MPDRSTRLLAQKGLEAALRLGGLAPEMVQARRLSRSAPVPTPSGPRVVMLSPRDWAVHVQLEALVAQALRMRGADVTVVGCGGGLELCGRVNFWEGPRMPCRTCDRYNQLAVRAHGLTRVTLRDRWDATPAEWPELDDLAMDELFSVEAEGIDLGRIVAVPIRWYLMRGNLADDPHALPALRAMLRSARRIARGLAAVLDDVQPDLLFGLNGLFLFEAVAAALCRERGIEVVTYERGFTSGTWFVSRGLPGACYEVGDAWEAWKDAALDAAEEARLDEVLRGRRTGALETALYQKAWRHGTGIRSSTGRLVALFTNITWDSAVIGCEGAFASLSDWLHHTIDVFERRPNDVLVVRVHPAETALAGMRTREPVHDLLATRTTPLPPNVVIVGPNEPLHSYELMDACDAGIVLTSTTGLEMAMAGKPVIVAGDVHFGHRGFTVDVDDRTTYEAQIAAVLAEPVRHRPDVSLARRYGYLFLERAAFRFAGITEPAPGLARVHAGSLEELRPGANADLDRLCDVLLAGAPLVPAPAGGS